LEVAKGIHRIGTGLVNVYLIRDGDQVTIIDAGAPAYWSQLPAALAEMGSSLDKVHSVVLTHGHSDHVGFAERIRRENGTPIRIHEADAALARGEVPNPSQGLGPIRIRPMLGFFLWGLRNGGLRIKAIREVVTFGDGANPVYARRMSPLNSRQAERICRREFQDVSIGVPARNARPDLLPNRQRLDQRRVVRMYR
jgi:glyoxylase-like metal-dependent hydrolase (beta-lactamase superfamily II)